MIRIRKRMACSVWKVALLMAVCLLSLIYNVIQYQQIRTPLSERMVGTYCTGDQELPGCEYVVLEPNDTYCWYRQFEILEVGTYSGQDTIFELEPDVENVPPAQFVSSGENLYWVRDDTVKEFHKITKFAMFVNVKPPTR